MTILKKIIMKTKLLLLTFLIICNFEYVFAQKILEENLIYRGQMAFSFENDEPITGKVIKNYESGEIKFQGEYLDGLKIGEWQEFYEDGSKKSIRNYINGKKDGVFQLLFNKRGGFLVCAHVCHCHRPSDEAGLFHVSHAIRVVGIGIRTLVFPRATHPRQVRLVSVEILRVKCFARLRRIGRGLFPVVSAENYHLLLTGVRRYPGEAFFP